MGAVTGFLVDLPALKPGERPTGDAMPLFTVDEVLEVTGARLLAGEAPRNGRKGFRRLSTDSRQIRRGDLFVALAGEQFDGRTFVDAAIRAGAAGVLVQAQSWSRPAARPVFGVPDTLLAYQQLASHHRSRLAMPLVAVTGSNGKTTTKDMVACVLGELGATLKTEGNFNNRIGVPHTLLRLTERHKAAVVEMGVDRKGQTARLCEIARPTIGIITNIGPDHLEFFGTLEASAHAKAELLDWIAPEGAVVLNADDAYFDYLASRAACPVLSFGLTPRAQVKATDIETDPKRGTTFKLTLPERTRSTKVVLPAHGTHNLLNALSAAAVGHLLGVSGAAIARGLAEFKPAVMRSQVRVWNGITIINDSYNANPASMKAALALLAQMGAGNRTIAVLGDMLELGPQAAAMHREIGAYLAEAGIAYLIACGPLGQEIAEGARAAGMTGQRVREAVDSAAASAILKPLVHGGDVVLVKGSRGMKMERVIEALTREAR